jgi:hypothetical protein
MNKYKKPLLIALLIALVIVFLPFGKTLWVGASATKALKRHFSQQSDIAGYEVKNTLWWLACCAQTKIMKPTQLNHVRFTVIITYRDGTSEEQIVELSDSRDETEQFDIEDYGGSIGQKWSVAKVYKLGETPYPVPYSM